jgi:hypothetical protein
LRRRFLGFDNQATYVKAAGQRFKDMCGVKVEPIRRGEAQPFLLTPTPFRLGGAEKFFAVAA